MEKEEQKLRQDREQLLYQSKNDGQLIEKMEGYIKTITPITDQQKADFKQIEKMLCDRKLSKLLSDKNYKTAFNEYHLKAVAKLQKRYPKVTNCQANVAVMLVEGLGNNEIALDTHTTCRNIETHRTMLRKALRLKKTDNLLQKIREAIE